MKNKKLIIIGAVVAVVLILVVSFIGSYNGLVKKQATVEEKWSGIEVDLQRRADLIPNLVETVKGYKDYEQSTLQAVTEARTAFKNADGVNEQVEAYDKMNSALNVWVNAVTEAYPELKANEQFTSLMDSLESTENSVAYARKQYNESVKEYNTSIKTFPRSIVAGMFGFDAFEYFEAQQGAQNNVSVNFD